VPLFIQPLASFLMQSSSPLSSCPRRTLGRIAVASQRISPSGNSIPHGESQPAKVCQDPLGTERPEDNEGGVRLLCMQDLYPSANQSEAAIILPDGNHVLVKVVVLAPNNRESDPAFRGFQAGKRPGVVGGCNEPVSDSCAARVTDTVFYVDLLLPYGRNSRQTPVPL